MARFPGYGGPEPTPAQNRALKLIALILALAALALASAIFSDEAQGAGCTLKRMDLTDPSVLDSSCSKQGTSSRARELKIKA